MRGVSRLIPMKTPSGWSWHEQPFQSSKIALEKPRSREKLGPIPGLLIVAAIVRITMVAVARLRRYGIWPWVYPALHVKLRARLQGALAGRRHSPSQLRIFHVALLEWIEVVFFMNCGWRQWGCRWWRRKRLAWQVARGRG